MATTTENTETQLSHQIKFVPPQLLTAHPINVKLYGEEPVDESLVESIREGGIIEELQVTAEHVIISGHRRCAAAIHLELETVPIRVRYDLDTEDKVVWALIEANRTQRVKTLEQKVREIMEINERVKALRAEVFNRYGTNDLAEIAKMDIDPGEVRTPGAKEVQKYIKDHNTDKNKSNKSIAIPLKHYGMSELHYKKARKAMNAIDAFVKKGKIAEANEIRRAMNTKGMKAFDKVVDRMQGTVVKKNFTSPSVLVKKSIDCFTEAIEHLPKESDLLKRCKLVIGVMTSAREELARMATHKEIGPSTEKIKNDSNNPRSDP